MQITEEDRQALGLQLGPKRSVGLADSKTVEMDSVRVRVEFDEHQLPDPVTALISPTRLVGREVLKHSNVQFSGKVNCTVTAIL